MLSDKEIEEAAIADVMDNNELSHREMSVVSFTGNALAGSFVDGAHFAQKTILERANSGYIEWSENYDKNNPAEKFPSLLEAWQAAVLSKEAEIARYRSDYKKDMAAKDKEIEHLKRECERLYEPTKVFWNGEKDKEIAELKSLLEKQEAQIREAEEDLMWALNEVGTDYCQSELNGVMQKAKTIMAKYKRVG